VSDCIRFTIPAVPVAQPRAKATTINGKARMYEAAGKHPIHAFKAIAMIMASQVHRGPPLEGPLAVSLEFVFACKSKRERKPKATRPDSDNLAKGLLDSLNGLLYLDDGQVCDLHVTKWHAKGDEQPHVTVEVRRLP
jgi:Holliday junction resolvase RusA-like endonuclease